MIYQIDLNNCTLNSDKTYTINGYVPCAKNQRIRINNFIIPYSFYTINNYNNKLLVTIVGTYTITIPIGNYTIITLCAQLQTLLKVVDASFTCTYSQLTNKITIARTGNFILDGKYSTLNKIIGFNYTEKTGADSYTGDNCFKLSPRFITFHGKNISDFTHNMNTNGADSYFETIPINSSSGNQINYVNQFPTNFGIDDNKNLNNDIWWFNDDDGNILDFNGVHPVIKIEYLNSGIL